MESMRFGNVSGMDDGSLVDTSKILSDEPSRNDTITKDGNLLWSYVNEGRLYGIPVAAQDRNLKIDREDLLTSAFDLVRHPKSELLIISEDDPTGLNRYNEILEGVQDGKISIVDETRQFDPAKCRFILWIRYDVLECALHPRYAYLREE
jgi:hypothetical protein